MNWKHWYQTLRERPADTWDASAWMTHLDAPSGFEREEATRALMRLRAPEALPGLMKRLNDWVPQVRAAAREAIHVYLDDALLAAWPAALPGVAHLLRARRADHGPMLSAIGDFLSQPHRVRVLLAHRQAAAMREPLVLRWLTTLEWNAADTATRQVMLSLRVDGADIVEALWAVRNIDSLDGPATRTALWLKSLDSPHGLVRAHALRRLCDAASDAGAAMAIRFALDGNPGVRAVALAQLRKSGGTEVVSDLALTQLQDPSRAPRGAVPAFHFMAAIDHDGTIARAEQLMSRIGADRPRAALRAIALQHLIGFAKGAAKDAWLLRALQDPSTSVQRVAVAAVENGADAPAPEVLWSVMLRHGTPSAFQRGLRIQRHWGIWVQFAALLKLLGTIPPGVDHERLPLALERWMDLTRRGVMPPPEPQASELRSLWAANADAMPRRLRRRMDFELSGIGLLPAPR